MKKNWYFPSDLHNTAFYAIVCKLQQVYRRRNIGLTETNLVSLERSLRAETDGRLSINREFSIFE